MQSLTGIMEKSGLEGVFLNPVKEPCFAKKKFGHLATLASQIRPNRVSTSIPYYFCLKVYTPWVG